MPNKQFKYYIIYKPFGMLSQFSKSNENEVVLADLNFKFDKDIYPAGRLDKDSEGLLLLSNDNKLKHTLMDPEEAHSKTYWVQVDGDLNTDAISKLTKGGLQIKHKNRLHNCKPADVCKLTASEIEFLPERKPPVRFRKEIPTSWIKITLTEGKNRQIRKMTAKVGYPTLRIIRVAINSCELGNLKPGEVKEVKELDFI